MSSQDIKQAIVDSLHAFSEGNPVENAANLFGSIGYASEKRPNQPSYAPQEFLDTYGKLNADKALFDQWKSVYFLFQLTADEIKAGSQLKFDFGTGKKVDNTIIESYLFFAIELPAGQYTRTQLAGITREINKLFPMPVMILFRHGETLTLSIINRRLHKLDESRDVLEKVTLIKDINFLAPHRAHIEILFDLSLAELQSKHGFTNFVELHRAWQKALDSSELNKRFFKEIANWYFWALQHVTFPKDAGDDEEVRNATSVIRMITRLIFIWFIKEKALVPDDLFDHRRLKGIINYADPKESTYYKSILQNLFFATLNQEMNTPEKKDNLKFRSLNKSTGGRDPHYNITNLYRYERYFHNPSQALDLFSSIPFLNGGLFECLDKPAKDDASKILRVDGFSDRDDNELCVPDFLFFSDEREVDLNEVYGTRNKRYKVRGLIDTFNRYKFTINENTPIEEEVALDPELLGKVFENLLANYNPETRATARKQTGSYYTPREIVNYMVDESLIAYLETQLKSRVPALAEMEGLSDLLREVFAYTEKAHPFNQQEVAALIDAIDHIKVLDPACGSGAFPMGILHKLVFILGKLDPHNQQWKDKQLAKAAELTDVTVREKVVEDIEEAFERNELDYGRKLYLIENCIYGVDIQPIAVQIAKLRFFISLVVDQKLDDLRENRGIIPLPNLETKFVAANTLVALERPQKLVLRNLAIADKEQELDRVRKQHFSARTLKKKRDCRAEDARLRAEISLLLQEDGFPRQTTDTLAYWDPYEQNVSAEFFDLEWMFGGVEGFDIVIANPPYLFITELSEEVKRYYLEHFKTMEYRFDVYGLFIETAVLNLLHDGGCLTYIVPHTLLGNDSYEKLRRFLLTKSTLRYVVDIGPNVFPGAKNETMVVVITKGFQPDTHPTTRVVKTSAKEFPRPVTSFDINQEGWLKNHRASWLVTSSLTESQILDKLERTPFRLDTYCTINQGLRTGDNERYLSCERTSEKWKPAAGGKEVSRYEPLPDGLFVYYDPKVLDAPRRREIFESADKLVVQEIRNITLRRRIVATYDDRQYYCLQSTNVVNLRKPDVESSLKFLLAILNSSAANFFFRLRFPGNNHIASNQLGQIPVPNAGKAQKTRLVDLVDQIIAVKKLDRQGDTMNLERQIDRIIYDLYGLNQEEIAIVEGRA